jgi:hypothetical protein
MEENTKHTMVVTLRNGVQIRMGVKSYDVTHDAGRITKLSWKADDDPFGNSIAYFDPAEVVAIHSERERI